MLFAKLLSTKLNNRVSVMGALLLPLDLPAKTLPRESEMIIVGGGCGFAGDGYPHAPNLFMYKISDHISLAKGERLKILGSRPSDILTKGYIISQEPGPCDKWPDQTKEVGVWLSSGKTRVESAFVVDPEGKLRPYSEKLFGQVEWQNGECRTKKENLYVYDIGNRLTKADYADSACDSKTPNFRNASPDRGFRILTEAIETVTTDSQAIRVRVRFRGTGDPVNLLFGSYGNAYFYPVNPGLSTFSWLGAEGRIQTSLKKGDEIILEILVSVKGKLRIGEQWISFAFRNLLDKNTYSASEPMLLTVEKSDPSKNRAPAKVPGRIYLKQLNH